MSYFFVNHVFDKGELKRLIHWFLITQGPAKTLNMVDRLKGLGFHYATEAGISLGIEDLKIPPVKALLLRHAEMEAKKNELRFARGKITAVERSQKVIDIWNTTSELLKEEVIHHFRETDLLNPVYMMAFSGARGNMSQVRQLVGMRGLMSDPKGEIIDLPIKSNFREGLTVTEYIISCYGARKGLVDTALKTANSGYLTRRLVDVAQSVIVNEFDCNTFQGILVEDLLDFNKVLISREKRLIGRVLSHEVIQEFPNSGKSEVQSVKKPSTIGFRNQEISPHFAQKLNALSSNEIWVRSPLTCQTNRHVCQLCYGWSLASGQLVELGEAIGIIAAQSIGEPGTQLTMRTFHTGGVFSGEVIEKVYSNNSGILSYGGKDYKGDHTSNKTRTLLGQEAFYFDHKIELKIKSELLETKLECPPYTLFFRKPNTQVYFKEIIAEYSTFDQISNQSKTSDGIITVKEVLSDLEGQVFFHFFDPQGKVVKEKFQENQVKGEGLIWVLSGKILASSLFNQPLIRKGDLILSPQIDSLDESLSFIPHEEESVSSSFFKWKVFSDGFLYQKPFSGSSETNHLLWVPLINNQFYFPTEFGYLMETIHELSYSSLRLKWISGESSVFPLQKRLFSENQTKWFVKSIDSVIELDHTFQKKFSFSEEYLKDDYELYQSTSRLIETFPAWFYLPKKSRKSLKFKQVKKLFSNHYAISSAYETLVDDIQFNESVFSKWYPSLKMFRFQKILSLNRNSFENPAYYHQVPSSLFIESGTSLLFSSKRKVFSKKLNSFNSNLFDLLKEKKNDFVEFINIEENGRVLVKQKENQIRFQLNDNKTWVKTGSLVFKGDNITEGLKSTYSGRVIQKTKTHMTLQIGQPYRTLESSSVSVSNGSLISQGKNLFSVVYKKAKTEDIVQGLPKIEELLEARHTKDLQPIPNSAHDRLQEKFQEYQKDWSIQKATELSFLYIQQFLVNSVQKVYQSQGVDISDKHVEIIVKQMTSKVFIVESGHTSFLHGDLVDFHSLKKINSEILGQNRVPAQCEPIILGITKASLKAESFISAASFQETTRVLTQAGIQGRLDSFIGLKENVIIGQLIPAGTGFLRPQLPASFTSTLNLFSQYASRFLLNEQNEV